MTRQPASGPWLTALVLLAAFVSSCETKSSHPNSQNATAVTTPLAPTPTPTPTPTPAPEPAKYLVSLSGTVTDESGAPVAGSGVMVEYQRPDGRYQQVNATPDGSGHYAISFEAADRRQVEPYAHHVIAGAGQYDMNTQVLTGNASDFNIDFRLRRRRTIDVGQEVAMSIEPDSSLWNDFESVFRNTLCDYAFVISNRKPNISVRLAEGSSISPSVSVSEYSAGVYQVMLGIPVGSPPQRYVVSTSSQD